MLSLSLLSVVNIIKLKQIDNCFQLKTSIRENILIEFHSACLEGNRPLLYILAI